jgi:arylsulfatase A-like enzyme
MRFQYIASGMLALWTVAIASAQILPQPDPPFQGKVDISPAKSTPDWPKPVTAPKGAPNVVLILLDDAGFAATSTFGGAAPTPALDRLAAGGLRYNRFHVNAMCSPTRGALLSGRNSHEIGFGMIAESAVGYPGYNALWPKSSAGIAEVLKLNGYSTAAFGKWHNTPVWDVNPAGPFERWPFGLGFEYFYGFLGAATSQWEPNLYRNLSAVEAPASPKEGYHLTTDLVNDAIGWLRKHDAMTPSKPFFLYFATGATHSPHHVPKEWVDKFKGKFDEGWDKLRQDTFDRQKELGVIPASAELTPRPKEIVAWDSLSPDLKKLLAHQMEVYAGFLAQTDYEVGRLLEAVRAEGHTEDTAVIYIAGDNGASAEGGADGRDAMTDQGMPLSLAERSSQYDALGSETFANMYATAWAWATNSPFQWAKRVASHLGGTRDAMVVSWPGHIRSAGGLRSQFHHVIDIAPTIYELAGIKPPDVVNGVKQTKLEGTSLVYTFEHPDEPSHHKVQYFEMLGSRGIYKDGWWAGSFNHLPWNVASDAPTAPPDQRPWELYNLAQDYSQAHNLAAQNPQKLDELKKLFDAEARRNNVYPLEPGRTPQPSVATGRTHFVFHEGDRRIPPASSPRLAGRAHRIDAEVMIPASGAEGVIIAQGGRQGGFTLYIKAGRVTYETSSFGHLTGSLVSSEPLGAGKASIVVEVSPAGAVVERSGQPGALLRPIPVLARLQVNGKPAGEARFAGFSGAGDTFDIGSDLVSPVSPKYSSPFAFTGKIDAVTIDLH